MSDFDCPTCAGEDRQWCLHSADEMSLARALAGFFHDEPPTDEKAGWFLYDAGVLLPEAGPGPYQFTKLEQGWHNDWAFVLNNLVVVLGPGGKGLPCHTRSRRQAPRRRRAGDTTARRQAMSNPDRRRHRGT